MAAHYGHIECLNLLHNCGYPWGERTCEFAARGGHLNCLKYAHDKGCPWDEETICCALLNGRLDCLRYAVENGCNYDVDIASKASRYVSNFSFKKEIVYCFLFLHEFGHGDPNGNCCLWKMFLWAAIHCKDIDCNDLGMCPGCTEDNKDISVEQFIFTIKEKLGLF